MNKRYIIQDAYYEKGTYLRTNDDDSVSWITDISAATLFVTDGNIRHTIQKLNREGMYHFIILTVYTNSDI